MPFLLTIPQTKVKKGFFWIQKQNHTRDAIKRGVISSLSAWSTLSVSSIRNRTTSKCPFWKQHMLPQYSSTRLKQIKYYFRCHPKRSVAVFVQSIDVGVLLLNQKLDQTQATILRLRYCKKLNYFSINKKRTSAAMLNKGWWVVSRSKLKCTSGETPPLSRAIFTFSMSPSLVALNKSLSMTKENSSSIY